MRSFFSFAVLMILSLLSYGDESTGPFCVAPSSSGAFFETSYHGNEKWYDSTFWMGPEWTRVGKNWQHPGQENDSARTFLVPKDGSVTVTGIVKKLHLDGDGVVAVILLDEKELWRKELDGKDDVGVDPNLTLDVKQGNKIRFVVNRRGNYSCDTTGWAPTITYTATGEKFDAAESFSDKQGNGGWFYEANGRRQNSVKPKIDVNVSETDYRRLSEGFRNVPDYEMFLAVVPEWIRDDENVPDLSKTIRDQLARCSALIDAGVNKTTSIDFGGEKKVLTDLEKEFAKPDNSETALKNIYLKTRLLKRSLLFADPRLNFGELLFVKSRPPAYSHLVGQYFGWNQRPGGGLYVLERAGFSLKHRDLLRETLPPGHVLEPRLSYDAKRIAFSHVSVPEERIPWESVAVNEEGNTEHYYHLYEMNVDGTGLRQLTADRYDDMMPEYLPDGGLAFVSNRRQAYSRCFGPQFGKRWHSYTLCRMEPDAQKGFAPETITKLSANDVSEWFPAVTNSGYLLFARWDYIDRDAVTHQNLWWVRPDGTNPAAVWGNAAPNPHCMFQAKAIPGSNKFVFIASAHHSITAGPVCLVDPSIDANSLDAVKRITPGPFPEAESMNIPEYYNSPWPLGEDLFLVAYSRDPLIFEPTPNLSNALGLYLLDDKGNRELLYRDSNIGATCPLPIAARAVPPTVSSAHVEALAAEGLGEMSIVNVYEGLGDVKPGSLKSLRIVQIFPKTTVVANTPRIGVAGEENTRAVLGVVPIEPDGSAKFVIPSGKPILFQVLDEDGFAYQTMRSTTSVMPGEQVSCIGCHEGRMSAATQPKSLPSAFARPASRLSATPESGRPYGFVEMVQPILDGKCVRCHDAAKPEGGYDLSRTIRPNGFTASYESLCRKPELVPRFSERNQIQQTAPGGVIGARGSGLIRLLKSGHEGVELTPNELERIGTWIDLNAVFYGSYDDPSLERQRTGLSIPMPVFQ